MDQSIMHRHPGRGAATGDVADFAAALTPWMRCIVQGAVLIAGAAAFLWSLTTLYAATMIIAALAAAEGLLSLWDATQLHVRKAQRLIMAVLRARRGRLGDSAMALCGLLLVLLGLLVAVTLIVGPSSFVGLAWVIGIYALFTGLTLVGRGLVLRRATREAGR